MVENLREIRDKGMENFLEKQEKKYRCPEYGDFVSVHDGKCYRCLQAWMSVQFYGFWAHEKWMFWVNNILVLKNLISVISIMAKGCRIPL
jgi:hypothetical protein